MSRRLRIKIALSAFHLSLAFCGAVGISLLRFGIVGQWLTYYGILTGADRGFGFFAPVVNTQSRVTFDIVDREGSHRWSSLESQNGIEAVFRIVNAEEAFNRVLQDHQEKMRRSIAASWAGKMFAKCPRAREISVNFETYRLVSMDEYRKGVHPEWVRNYRATFLKTR